MTANKILILAATTGSLSQSSSSISLIRSHCQYLILSLLLIALYAFSLYNFSFFAASRN